MAILTELKDPRVEHVTVTGVEVAGDMRTAKVHVSIMGDATRERLALAGLRSAAGFLQSRIRDRIDTRYTPKLEFELDSGVKKSIAVAKILSHVLPPPSPGTVEAEFANQTAAEEEVGEAAYEEEPQADSPPDAEPPSTRPPAFRPGGRWLGGQGET